MRVRAPGAVRLVITSDNHLNRHYDRMSPERLRRRRAYLRRGFELAVDHALSSGADFFVQAGDLFDTVDPRNADRDVVAAAFQRLRQGGISVIGIAGNHDTPRQMLDQGGAVPQAVYHRLGGMHLLEGEGAPTICPTVRDIRVAIGAVPFRANARGGQDPLDGLTWGVEADVRVFLFHHGVEGTIYAAANEPIVSRSSLERFQSAQLVVAGHVHHAQQWTVGTTHVVVPGATELMTFGETGAPGFWIADISAGGVEHLEQIPVTPQPRYQATIHTTDLVDSETIASGGDVDLTPALLRRVETLCQPEAMVKVRLEGPISREGYRALDLRKVSELMNARAFHFDLDTHGLTIAGNLVRGAGSGLRPSQQEELAACADALIEETTDPHERALLEETRAELLAYYQAGVMA